LLFDRAYLKFCECANEGEVMLWNHENRVTTITGVIIPADWDQNGGITGVAISTHDEDEYLVQDRAKGAELVRLLRKEVEVTGWAELDQGKKTIVVTDYRLLKRKFQSFQRIR